MGTRHSYQPLTSEDDIDTIKGEFNSIPIPLDAAERKHQRQKQQSSFDRLFLRRFFRILRILFSSPSSEGNILGLLMLFVTVCGVSEVTVYFAGTIPSMFVKVLLGQEWESFKRVTLYSAWIVLCSALGMSLVKFMGGRFALTIRRILTTHLQRRYVKSKTFYQLLTNYTNIDNPDQRITQDVDKFAETIRLICEEILISPISIAYYTYKCWALSGYLGPLLIYTYFIVGSIVTRFFIVPIVNLVFMKEYHEGNFRYLHVRIRQFAESIAFSRGEQAEVQRLDGQLQHLLFYQRLIINKELFLQAVTETFSYFGSILSYLIIAIPIFTKKYEGIGSDELGSIIALNAFLSIYLINRFTVIVQQSTKISDLAGYTARIGQLSETITEISNELENIDIDFPYGGQLSDNNTELAIEFEQVSITSPSGVPLLSELKFIIEQDKNAIIIGPNGSGKSSILRVMSGLWPAAKGRVLLPRPNIIYLPQTPYLVCGSLRDQITYPLVNTDKALLISDEEVRELLETVNLSHIEKVVKTFDAQYGQDWDKMLSPGEQQKLMFARLFHWKPAFAALDEATSSLDSDTENRFFERCKEHNITCITVSHNKNLLQFHDKVLLLDGKGRYTTSDIDINGSGDIEKWIEKTLRIL